MLLHALAHREDLPVGSLGVFLQRQEHWRDGGGGRRPSRFSRIHLPRCTGDVRFAAEVTIRKLPCPSKPARASSFSQRDAAEVAAVDVRESRSAGRAARRRTCSPRSADRRRCGPRARCFRTTFRSRAGTPAAGFVEVGNLRSGFAFLQVRASSSHWPAKLVDQRSARGSASIRRTCCSSTAGSRQLSLPASIQQLIVGNAAPQKERQPRREFDIARADRLAPAATLAGSRSKRNRKPRIDQNARQAHIWMPVSKVPSARPA